MLIILIITKYLGVYSRKPGLTPHQIETYNNQWTKLHQYDEFVYSRISHFQKLAANENKSLMKAAKLPNFSQLKCTSSNIKQDFKSFTNLFAIQMDYSISQKNMSMISMPELMVYFLFPPKKTPPPINCLHPI